LERPPQGTSEAALWRRIIKIFHVATVSSAASLGQEKNNGTLGPRRLMHAVELEATTLRIRWVAVLAIRVVTEIAWVLG
jgi:hypothetical protein